MSRFVRPDVTVLKISQGDSLTVKARLNSGEEREMFARQYVAGVDGQLKANPFAVGMALITAYLLDWTLTDDDGKVVPIRDVSIEQMTSTLNTLDPSSYAEIRQAIEAHDDAVRLAREQAKNDQGGGMESPATSPSLSDAAGVTNGSVNSTRMSEPS